jgi:ABC-2 type transport system permease protein
MVGKTLGGATVAFIQGIIVFIIASLFGFRTSIAYIPLALVFMFLIAVLFTAVGISIASKMNDMHAFPLIMNLLLMPLFFLSGALFPLENLPKIMGIIVKINPLSYGVDGLRGTLIGVGHMGLFTDFSVLAILTIISLFLGGYLFSKIEA